MLRRLVCICIAMFLLCTGCARQVPCAVEQSVSAPDTPSLSPPDLSPADPEPVDEPLPVPVAPETVPEPPLPPEPKAQPEPEIPSAPEVQPAPEVPSEPHAQSEPVDKLSEPVGYDFSSPVPESPAVENDYFSDAAFVGDSRTEGFWLFSGIKQGKKLTCDGLSVFTLAHKKAINVNGSSYTLLEALTLQPYAKVYLCLGVNELGYRDDEAFYQAYCDTIDAVRACQPDAVIYVQTLPPLNEGKIAASGGFGYLKNSRLRAYNELICRAAAEKQVALLDLYTLFAVDGQLPAEASRDGVHLLSPYCKIQLEYFKTHTVDFHTLYPTPQEPMLPIPEEPTPTEVPEP